MQPINIKCGSESNAAEIPAFETPLGHQANLEKTLTRNTVKRPVAKVLYHLYSRRLLRQINGDSLPRHIAVILDGNRRFARGLGISASKGHELGYENVELLMRWCWELGVRELTLFAFSTENFDRTKAEIDHLMELLRKGCLSLSTSAEIHENQVSVKAIGRLKELPGNLQDAIRVVEKKTRDYNRFHLNLAIAYGGRAEILDAVKNIYRKIESRKLKIEEIDETTISDNLYKVDMTEPDMIIRTSGEQRLSGFLLWQSAYSELYFTEANFPAFRKIDFLRAIRNFQNRHRRFGK